MTADIDRRFNACRPDLADQRLEGRVKAARFVEGRPAHIKASVTDLRPRPDPACTMDSQVLMGEDVLVFERQGGWAWVMLKADSYVGYIREEDLQDGFAEVTHIVARPRTFLYPGPDLRFPVSCALSMGSRLKIVGEAHTRGTKYALLADGKALIDAHCRALGEVSGLDAVGHAALMIETPYLWGGRSGFGIDCSGLVQMGLAMNGAAVARDSDMQAATLGRPINPEADGLMRGDLVFWKGHVAFMENETMVLHASGGTMSVTREPLAAAIARIEPFYGPPTGYRRP